MRDLSRLTVVIEACFLRITSLRMQTERGVDGNQKSPAGGAVLAVGACADADACSTAG